ncbi:hypothetical protein IV203_027650 [Nitzschia inconspicua]|uniref:Uncharacterized protein n=1 Tax=Nitzschia inconspicua TaxID=303405 RepID=A0A9K3LWP9_9STRA|nr:hypothetical protein IV203_027650 [Nitzschia inconspicua]
MDEQSSKLSSSASDEGITHHHQQIPTTYEKYMDLTQRVLQKSRKSLDTQVYIQQAYGEEKMAILGGSDMLQGILDGLLDKMAYDTVLKDFAEYCNGKNNTSNNTVSSSSDVVDDVTDITPKQQMDRIDEAIRFVLDWEAQRDEMDWKDAQTAQRSLDASLLPEGVSTEDVVRYREHLQKLQARVALQQEVHRVEAQIATMQQEQAQTRQQIQEQLSNMHTLERQLEDAANACAMVTN